MTEFAAFLQANFWGLIVLVGGGVITIWGFTIIVGRTTPPKERDDEAPTNPKGKIP